jgi:signal transduction histidine kinase/CheY-like chemotaxis protein
MKEPQRRHESAAETAVRELAELQGQVDEARALLIRLRQQVTETEGGLANNQAAQLLEANEQLVLSTLRAQAEAVTTVLALDEASQSAELQAQTESRAREAMVRLNASLEDRVSARTRELEQSRDEALAGVRAKEQFLSNMSHEIRTPMNGMLGALELVAQTELTPRQAQFIRVATASGEALLGILNEVLDFAKIGANRFQLAADPIDVNAIARSVTTMFSASAQRKSIELQLRADPSLSDLRLGDALRLRQVLMNLVGNAMKFTPQGQVVVKTRRAGGAKSDHVAFEVSDTGLGIAASQHERIFEAFVQADDPLQQHRGGTGLGLAISRQLVRAMGGELEVVSALGQGATFRFELSLERAPDPTPSPAAQPPVAVRREPLSGRVLLVEDNSVNRLIGSAMLESLGLDVLLAEHGEEALATLAEASVAAVLMDCQMPVMDGFEATHRIREAERLSGGPRVPVIALTANAFSGDVERCLAIGMDAHLAKPYTIDQLRAIIAPWLPNGTP